MEFKNDSEFVNVVASPNDFSDDPDHEEPILDYDEMSSTLTSKSKRQFNFKATKQKSYMYYQDMGLAVTKGVRGINIKKKSTLSTNLSLASNVNSSITDSSPCTAKRQVETKFVRRASMTQVTKWA